MRKSSAIFVSAIALGLAMFVPLKASAQGVTIYINPVTQARRRVIQATRLIHAIAMAIQLMDSYPSYGYGYGYNRPYYGGYWGHNPRLRAELIGDGTAGTLTALVLAAR